LKTLPPVHPREPPVTTSSAAVASRLNASHVCTFSTLRECENDRNGKLMLSCAETVEDETCLWKDKEKAEEIRAVLGGHSSPPLLKLGVRLERKHNGVILSCEVEMKIKNKFNRGGQECSTYTTRKKGTTEAVPFNLC
jgi:hypothetical protein